MQTMLLRDPEGTLLDKKSLQLPQAITSKSTRAKATTADPTTDYSLSLCAAGHPLRSELEDYIARRYARRHHAAIEHYLPHLLALKNGQRTYAALGLSSAHNQALFLEAYLDKPIEQVISQQFCTPVDRKRVVEIGNLAASQRAASTLLFTLLSALLDQAGYRWIVFTATPCVQALVASMGFSLQCIGEARAERIDAGDNWGSYYETRPQVMVGCIDEAMRKALSPEMQVCLTAHKQAINAIASRI
jgi:hypothetical protein